MSFFSNIYRMHMDKELILILGGAGFIGSHVNKLLNQSGYSTLVLDNLSSGSKKSVLCGTFIEGDLADKALLDRIFTQYPIRAVMHFAAFIDVGESVVDPLKYYMNNVVNTIAVLEAMVRHGVRHFVFSSSAAIFGDPLTPKITEDHQKHPINPYGNSKWIVETILRDFDRAYGLKSSALRYFNAAGGDPEGEIKNFKKKEGNLIPIVLRSLRSRGPSVTIFGTNYPTPDGTCIRDYIHVQDLATAHLLAMEQLFAKETSTQYNLGNGDGYSVRQVIAAAEKLTGIKAHVIEGAPRAGDPPVLLADATKAQRELGWRPLYPALEMMIEHAYSSLV